MVLSLWAPRGAKKEEEMKNCTSLKAGPSSADLSYLSATERI